MQKIISDIVQERIKQGLSESRLSVLAGLDQKNVNNILTGRTKKPDYMSIVSMQQALGIRGCQDVDVYSLLEMESGAGCKWFLCVGRKAVPAQWAVPGIRFIEVKGWSMAPFIRHGAIVGINENDKQLIDGDVYALAIPQTGATIKRVFILPGRLVLRPDNKGFEEFTIYCDSLHELFILGRVCWLMQDI